MADKYVISHYVFYDFIYVSNIKKIIICGYIYNAEPAPLHSGQINKDSVSSGSRLIMWMLSVPTVQLSHQVYSIKGFLLTSSTV